MLRFDVKVIQSESPMLEYHVAQRFHFISVIISYFIQNAFM